MSEMWLSGPVQGVAPTLLPPAHTFLQVREEIATLLSDVPVETLWQRVGQSASIGFHAVHLAGSTDRLLTYARGEQLSSAQMEAFRGETTMNNRDGREVIAHVQAAMDAAIAQLRATPADSLFTAREVGRKKLPSTTFGLIVHAAEHALRHVGQIATLKKVLG